MKNNVRSTHVLLRTKEITPAVLALADHLETISGHAVALIVDASRGDVKSEQRTVINLSIAACRELGLHCPADFAWKCGDYGYYLARRRFPDTELFWMLETDVGFCGEDPPYFFRFFAEHRDVDFLAGKLQPAGRSWFWRNTASGRGIVPFQCLFPVTRLSRRAIDAAFAHRLKHGRRLNRRILWPNDEAFMATTLMNGDFVTGDFNDFGPSFYSDETYYYGAPMNADSLKPGPAVVQIFHPILPASQYAAKILTLQQRSLASDSWTTERLRWTAHKLNAISRW
ncbi:MAG TPA: hypothetical protein VGV09_19610 [Steroidobacteraceae bacterium]|nr:hypothetical protein [Steroidobacteraceae bacterium]